RPHLLVEPPHVPERLPEVPRRGRREVLPPLDPPLRKLPHQRVQPDRLLPQHLHQRQLPEPPQRYVERRRLPHPHRLLRERRPQREPRPRPLRCLAEQRRRLHHPSLRLPTPGHLRKRFPLRGQRRLHRRRVPGGQVVVAQLGRVHGRECALLPQP